MAKSIKKKHPLAIRWFHWINFPVLFVMIYSGLLIYWANDIYSIQLGQKLFFKFFPDAFYKALTIPFRLAQGMALHFLFMWIFFINGFAYVIYTMVSGEWRHLLPGRNSLKEAWQVVLHDLFISRKKLPVKKFNGAQQIAYTGIILMGIGSLLTGLVMYKPTQFSFLTRMLGGYEWARGEHFILTIGYVLFFCVHIMQVVRAGWNNFRAIVTGWEVTEEKPQEETILVDGVRKNINEESNG
jgi:thiosulfate reductase cytochrome b subunit